MSSLLVPWLGFPLLLIALSLGCGLLVERVSLVRLPGTLLLPTGYALLTVIALFATMNGATAFLATPAVCVAAGLGFFLARNRVRPILDWWATAATFGVFAVYAAPVVLSGQATFPGYIKLDDDSTFMTNLDRVMGHGRNIAGLAPSTYLATLQPHLAKGYPMGAVIPIGVGRQIVGGDVLWLYHPCVAWVAAMLALALYELAARVVSSRWLRGLAAFVGAQSALMYGYALWGGLKEVAAAAMIALAGALIVPGVVRAEGRARGFLPLATACAAVLGIQSAGGAIWILPALAGALAMLMLTRSGTTVVRAAAGFAVFGLVLSIPTLVVAKTFLGNRIFEFDYLANLVKPLNSAQLAGVWLIGDFRFDPHRPSITYVLIAVVIAAAVSGMIWSLVRRAWELPVYVAGTIVACFVFFTFSTPWIDGKALATASAAIPMVAIVGSAPLFSSGRRAEGALLAGAIAGGVLWSNALQYHDAWLAPRKQLAELQSIGNRFAGDGPTLMTEYQPYGVRHFLRKMDGEGASELRIRPVPLRTGQLLQKGNYANIDEFQLDAVLVYRSLVLRTSPTESRPPSVYKLIWKGRFYEVWQRPERGGRRIREHLPLGSDLQPASAPSCASVLRLARVAGPSGELATVERPPSVVVGLSANGIPRGWAADNGGNVIPAGKGTLVIPVDVPRAGEYGLWLGGSFRDRLELDVDGRKVKAIRNQLNNGGQYTPFGSVRLTRGRHVVTFRYSGPSFFRPGSAGAQFLMGPLVLSATTADLPVNYVRAADAQSLCGKNLDWVEALGP